MIIPVVLVAVPVPSDVERAAALPSEHGARARVCARRVYTHVCVRARTHTVAHTCTHVHTCTSKSAASGSDHVRIRVQRERVADPHAHPGARAGTVDDLESICLRRDRRGSRCVMTMEWTARERQQPAGLHQALTYRSHGRAVRTAADLPFASPISGGPGTQSNGLAHTRLAYAVHGVPAAAPPGY